MSTTQAVTFEELELRLVEIRSSVGLSAALSTGTVDEGAPAAGRSPRPGRRAADRGAGRRRGMAADVLLLGAAWVGLLTLVALAL